MNTSYIGKLFIVCKAGLQSSILKETLDQALDVTVELIDYDYLEKVGATQLHESVFLFDYEEVSQEHRISYLKQLKSYNTLSRQVLFNSPSDISLDYIMSWTNIIGIFYRTDSICTLAQGLSAILEGEFWLGMSLKRELLLAYRQAYTPQIDYANIDLVDFTSREEQVLHLLLDGVSNQEIAQKLFVSENTVKTHLHNTFKKMQVRNRVQALMWLKKSNYVFKTQFNEDMNLAQAPEINHEIKDNMGSVFDQYNASQEQLHNGIKPNTVNMREPARPSEPVDFYIDLKK